MTPKASLGQFSCGTAQREASLWCHNAASGKYTVGFRGQWVTVATSPSVRFHVGHIVCEMWAGSITQLAAVRKLSPANSDSVQAGKHWKMEQEVVRVHMHTDFKVCCLTHTPYGIRQMYAWLAQLAACTCLHMGFGGVCMCGLSRVPLCNPVCTCKSGQTHKSLQRVCSKVHYDSWVGGCCKVTGWILTTIRRASL